MAKYKFNGYTITNCGYHQPDHCVWWEAVDENGAACFHGNTLREVEFMILDYEWEQKMKEKDKEIERLKSLNGNAAAMREALENIVGIANIALNVNTFGNSNNSELWKIIDKCKSALSAPARNCDRFRTKEEARAYFDNIVCMRSNGSGAIECKGCPLDSIDNPHRADCRESWLFAPAAERKGEGDEQK